MMWDPYMTLVSEDILDESNETEDEETTDPFCRRQNVGQLSDIFRLVNLIYFGVAMILALLSMGWWIANRKKHYLHVRPTAAMMLTTIGYMLGLVAQPFVRWKLDAPNYLNRCSTSSLILSSSIFLIVAGGQLKYIVTHNKNALVKKLVHQYATMQASKMTASAGLLINTRTSFRRSEISRSSALSASTSKEGPKLSTKKLVYRSSQRYSWRLSMLFVLGSIGCAVLSTSMLCPEFRLVDCNLSRSYRIATAVSFIGTLFAMGSLYYMKKRTQHHPDPFGLQREIYVSIISGLLVFPLLAAAFLLSEPSLRATEDQEEGDPSAYMDYTLLVDVALAFCFVHAVPYQVFIARKHPNNHYDLRLIDILRHPLSRDLFHQHLCTELTAPNLAFWLSVQDWKEQYSNESRFDRETIAKEIFELYFSPDSSSEVNVSYFARQRLEQIILADIEYPVSTFDEVSKELFKLMEDDTFFRFKISNQYRFYMGLGERKTHRRSSTRRKQ